MPSVETQVDIEALWKEYKQNPTQSLRNFFIEHCVRTLRGQPGPSHRWGRSGAGGAAPRSSYTRRPYGRPDPARPTQPLSEEAP